MPRLVLTPARLPLRQGLAPGVQRLGLLVEVPSLLRQLGVRPASVLRKVGLTAAALADREATIPYVRAVSLLAECARATQCEHFGLLAGSRWRLDHLGLPGEIARNSATVGGAIERFTSWHWMNTTGGVAFLTRDNGVTTFGYAVFEPGVGDGIFQLYDLVIAIAVGMLRELSDNTRWKPLSVHLSHARPLETEPYRRFFGAPVRFDSESSLIHFPSTCESMPVRSADEARRRALEAKLLALGQEDLLPRLYRMLRVALLFGLKSGDEIAAAMGLRRRTFHRRLDAAGTTFRDALETVRFEVARQLLGGTDLAVSEIGAALGYAETSPFVRAFRRWSGDSPSAWRLRERAARRR